VHGNTTRASYTSDFETKGGRLRDEKVQVLLACAMPCLAVCNNLRMIACHRTFVMQQEVRVSLFVCDYNSHVEEICPSTCVCLPRA
jgi:hypothetical protein